MDHAKKALGASLVVAVVAVMTLVAGGRLGSIAEAAGTTPSTTSLISGANPNVHGQSVTFTATVTGTSGTPTGTVTFFNGVTASSTKTLVAGAASWTTTTLPVGSASITATFNGNTTYAVSNSPALVQVTNKTATATTLTPSANPTAFAAPVTFTAFVAASLPGSGSPSSGMVKFFDGSVLIGSAAPSAGSAAITLANLSVGTHSISAAFGGSASYSPSTSAILVLFVGAAPTSTALVATPNPVQLGGAVTLTATVLSATGTPAGTVSFSDGPTVIGSATLVSGQATISTSTLGAGDHTIAAAYGGNATLAASVSAGTVVTVTFGPATTTTQLTAAPNPSIFGTPVTFSATVAAASGTPTGTVTFLDGLTVLGVGNVSSGQASISTALLAVGDHVVTAAYSGDSAFGASGSAPVTQTVGAAPTTTDLVAAPNPALIGTAVSFTATVSGGIAVPTGTVTFFDGLTTIGTVGLVNGQAAMTTSSLTIGNHSVTASYGGDAAFAPSSSGVVTEAVNVSATTTSLTATPTATTYGSSVTFSATVTSGGGTPTGTVTFSDGASGIGTVGLANGQASLTTSSLAVGSHTVTASYNASIEFATSTSTEVIESVDAAATTTTLTGSPNPSGFGSLVTFTAIVTSPGVTPTGTVSFLDGTTALGSGTLNAGQATLATSALAAGAHSISAVYGATANFTASTSAAVIETVTASAGNVLSVDRGNANCRDSGAGAGSGATPFCTIGAAAGVATAGVTVVVASGTYAGNVSIKNSGTSTAPITITTGPGANVTVTGGSNGFVASNKSWIVIRGFNVTQTNGAGITVSNGSNNWIDRNHVSAAGVPSSGSTAVGIKFSGITQSVISNNTTDHNSDAGIYTNSSNNNTIRNNTSFSNARGYVRAAAGIDVRAGLGNQVYGNVSHDNEDSGINAWTGATTGSNFFSNNVTYANGDHGIDVHNGLDSRVVANTVYGNYDSGIEMTTSTGTVLANNVSVDNGINSARTAGQIRVDAGSVGTTTLNDDLVFLRVAGDVIDWNGVKYLSLAAFRTATGQESRGIQADPRLVSVATADFRLSAGSAAIDSANSGAPNQPLVDFGGSARIDDPLTVDTGLGSVRFADRGAFEYRP